MDRSDAVETGRVVFGAWKHVRLYGAIAQGRLGATSFAGKAGDLLGRLRMLQRYEIEPLAALASDVGISRHELENLTLSALEMGAGLHVERMNLQPVAVLPIAVDQDDVMRSSRLSGTLPAHRTRSALQSRFCAKRRGSLSRQTKPSLGVWLWVSANPRHTAASN